MLNIFNRLFLFFSNVFIVITDFFLASRETDFMPVKKRSIAESTKIEKYHPSSERPLKQARLTNASS
ncbi:unnamed protein product [Acanthoscelides obtectus]|uniref:Uncharacterized protein n=1 Tax=Acanthoscelides obtectus TaxID=200917 RepID=A0A9P0KM73_ACAOB|nr:unnamed protein product [Acanthoscelides obtectus]CAK1631776.1 hypothetical protein AOBTE_LOCUS7152 [Acanthoscelides obtectus]